MGSSASSSWLLGAADRTVISLVWSSRMESEPDLLPGETVCFLCPAHTKSHIVLLPISHAHSALQVLGYLADGCSGFRSVFFFILLTEGQEYVHLSSPLYPCPNRGNCTHTSPEVELLENRLPVISAHSLLSPSPSTKGTQKSCGDGDFILWLFAISLESTSLASFKKGNRELRNVSCAERGWFSGLHYVTM